jgi:uncharacterized protein (DUF305 family)
MKKGIFTNLVLTGALALLGAACQPTETVRTNSAANQSAANGNSTINANSMSGNQAMNHNSMTMDEHANMSGMSDMKSSPNAASAPYDLQFLDTMSHHHQGAVDMAKAAVEKAQHPELKAFAQKIIVDQNKEIAQMKDWREKWFAGKPAAMNMEMSGMTDSMKMMSGDGMKRLEAATGNDFDLMFVEMMTPHHDGAVVMSKEALQKAEHPEIKLLANQIIKAQEAEIKKMADWKKAWSK